MSIGRLRGYTKNETLLQRILGPIKRSFLLFLTAIGVVLMAIGLALDSLGEPIWAAVLGGSGVFTLLTGLIGYATYKALARVF